MTLQLEHVLAGIGLRTGEKQRDADVDGISRGIEEIRQRGVTCAGNSPTSVAAISGVLGPETRTMPTPPRPAGVAAATMVS